MKYGTVILRVFTEWLEGVFAPVWVYELDDEVPLLNDCAACTNDGAVSEKCKWFLFLSVFSPVMCN